VFLAASRAHPRAYPATAIIFVGSLLTLVFGVLNLIVAVASWTLLQKGDHGGGEEFAK